RPRTLLGERLNAVVMETLAGLDVILLSLRPEQRVRPGERHLPENLAGVRARLVAVENERDLVRPQRMGKPLLDIKPHGESAHIVPLSAVSVDQLDLLTSLVIDELPEGPMLYPEGDLTDEPDYVRIAEFVREAALEGVREELPHSIAALVDEIVPREGRTDGLLDVRVHVFVERHSQKA